LTKNCGIIGSNAPGRGIEKADFIFYISAMETERCCGLCRAKCYCLVHKRQVKNTRRKIRKHWNNFDISLGLNWHFDISLGFKILILLSAGSWFSTTDISAK